MQLEYKQERFKRLKLVLGKDNVERLKKLTILVVGVGGIGCEVLKNLSKHPLKKIVIIDLDIIEISNLNRQFYFRMDHLSQSKAKIARQQILNLVPDLNIEAIQGNIYDKQFNNFSFYSQFDVVISALDNLKARQHVAKNCTRFGKIIIDAGTSGFNGQSYSSVRFAASCHNCYPSIQEENFAVCTIRSRPERSIHCAIYAKYIYESLFTDENPQNTGFKQIKENILHAFPEQINTSNSSECAIKLFNYLFYYQFKLNELEQRLQVNGLTFQDALKSVQPLESLNSEEKYDSIWSLQQYAQTFINYFCKLIEKIQCLIKVGSKASLVYDKDDYDCSLFICCVCNLRVYNFKNSHEKSNKLQYLTFDECRKLIGKIIPAIASTNSMAASLQIKQLSHLLSSQQQQLKYFTISPFNDHKISFSFLSLPNPQCQVCSPHYIYFHIKCNLTQRTFGEFQQFALNHCYSHNRDLYSQNFILVKNLNTNKISPNKKKTLNFKSDLIIMNTLTLVYIPTAKISNLKVQITLINEENVQNGLKFEILNYQQVQKTLQILNSSQRSIKNIFHAKQEQNFSDILDYQLID